VDRPVFKRLPDLKRSQIQPDTTRGSVFQAFEIQPQFSIGNFNVLYGNHLSAQSAGRKEVISKIVPETGFPKIRRER